MANEDLKAGKDSGLDILDADKMVDDREDRKAFDADVYREVDRKDTGASAKGSAALGSAKGGSKKGSMKDGAQGAKGRKPSTAQ